ncbi:MAG: hypothetical protein VKJ04_04255 [Vampirovibrionales bacterium]|nr:hypothetical protein [Vampirovibrionales bacterium]
MTLKLIPFNAPEGIYKTEIQRTGQYMIMYIKDNYIADLGVFAYKNTPHLYDDKEQIKSFFEKSFLKDNTIISQMIESYHQFILYHPHSTYLHNLIHLTLPVLSPEEQELEEFSYLLLD